MRLELTLISCILFITSSYNEFISPTRVATANMHIKITAPETVLAIAINKRGSMAPDKLAAGGLF